MRGCPLLFPRVAPPSLLTSYGAASPLPRQPLRDLFLRLRARCRIGAEMAVLGYGGIKAAGSRMQRRVGAVEVVIGAGIDHDARERAAAMRTIDHLAAGRRRRDVVIATDQHQRRHPCAPP